MLIQIIVVTIGVQPLWIPMEIMYQEVEHTKSVITIATTFVTSAFFRGATRAQVKIWNRIKV